MSSIQKPQAVHAVSSLFSFVGEMLVGTQKALTATIRVANKLHDGLSHGYQALQSEIADLAPTFVGMVPTLKSAVTFRI